jgi:hypothetical protein
MSNVAARLTVGEPAGNGLAVEFFRRQDRYVHVIYRIATGLALPVWETVEGTDAEDWPASPPLQQLSIQTLPDGRRVALLVGMAGTSHWSLSVEPSPSDTALIFDVACRLSQPAVFLGSRYQRCATWEAVRGVSWITAVPCDEPAASDTLQCTVQQGDSLVIVTPLVPSALPPRTVRWKYRLFCA